MSRWDKDLMEEYQKLKGYHDSLLNKCKEIRQDMKEILEEMERS